ncbi:glycoside hydrolase family 10 protein [Croceivirga thetidis]|uniref:Family 10 glycosylhydrolase n=1 Tax=Croceivirga thetidis TaxID=2721623 RepID=A0ABX1GS84_9FLAO|nr:family 10 glycosylhydrolase [Croceivirga thetidis]NKI32803.1 family 10 glycosylhydrolase [Croceivirga thetidis]
MIKKLSWMFLFMIVFSCSPLKSKAPQKEFRGVWIATVVNIDWPTKGSDEARKQKEDFIKLLDYYDDLNFNVVIVQIRTAGDAFYDSKMAPWSRFLTGKEGNSKAGFENPLQWMIEETHKRGIQFHAWLNPYRATFDLDTTVLSKNHDFFEHKDWMVKYGKKYYYNPGMPDVWKHLTNVVEEVVVNFDIDGIHFDDYFYPYKVAGETFKDSLTHVQFGLPNQNRADWRRSNVDSLIKNVHKTIKRNKTWVQFGVSPFGVWKNNTTDPSGSDTKAGQTTYEDLYADPLLWIRNDWLDYIVPQAYWSMDYPAASHKKIAMWWSNKTDQTNLFMGNGAYKIRNNPDEAWDNKNELLKQLKLARSIPEVKGNVFFSSKSIPKHPDVSKKLKRKLYKYPSEAPTNQKIIKRTVTEPVILSKDFKSSFKKICISHFDSVPSYLSIYKGNGNKSRLRELLKKVYLPPKESKHCIEFNSNSKRLFFVVKDAFGNASQTLTVTN